MPVQVCWKKIIRALGIVLPLVFGAQYTYEVQVARPAQSLAGVPIVHTSGIASWNHILRNPGFMLAYSEWHGIPLWVTYELQKDRHEKFGKRPDFVRDWRTLHGVTTEDYRYTGYDRGHMAPNYAIGKNYGREGQLAAFKLSNIVPQTPKLNQKVWQRLEEVVMDHFVPRFDSVWVVTGPIVDKNPEYLRYTRIAIPSAFYKILVAMENGQPVSSLAFVMPQDVQGNEPLEDFVTTIDGVEGLTGIDFFPQLDAQQEEYLESQSHPQDWRLQAVSRLPGRY